MSNSAELKSVFASLPRTERGKPIVIGGDPKGKNFLYVNGTSVIVRDLESPSKADVYTEHAHQTTCAKYSPSGFYIASGDAAGKIRIWDTTQAEHLLKYEYQPIGGAIRDIAWSPDSKRIAIGGEGREKFASCFMWDTGTSVGELIGPARAVNSIDYRSERPYRVVTGSEDFSSTFYEGPPFKSKCTLRDHNNFVNAVRFSPNGDKFIAAGANGKLYLYDGKTGDLEKEIGSEAPKGGCQAHKGGIYSICFSPDGERLLTVSGDKTAKIWDIAENRAATEFTFGNKVEDMQVGCLWQGEHIITVSLSGHINYLDPNNPAEPSRILKGHNKPITAMSLSEDKSTIFSGSSDGHMNHWNANTGLCDDFKATGHSNQIQDMATIGDEIVTVGMDDTVRFANASERKFCDGMIKLESQPKCIAAWDRYVVVGCIDNVVVLENRKLISQIKVKYQPNCVSIHPGGTEVAIGGYEDNKVHIYNLSGGTLSETKDVVEVDGPPNDVKYSPDGAYIAVGGSCKKVYLFSVPGYKVVFQDTNHLARVNTIAWAPNSQYFASGSLDSSIIFWKLKSYTKKLIIRAAHPKNQITRLEWIDNHRLVSAGQDSCIKQWTVNFS